MLKSAGVAIQWPGRIRGIHGDVFERFHKGDVEDLLSIAGMSRLSRFRRALDDSYYVQFARHAVWDGRGGRERPKNARG